MVYDSTPINVLYVFHVYLRYAYNLIACIRNGFFQRIIAYGTAYFNNRLTAVIKTHLCLNTVYTV